MPHLQKSKTNHLVFGPSHNPATYNYILKWATDTWHAWPSTASSKGSADSQNPTATRTNINESPAAIYSTVYASVLSNLTSGTPGTISQWAVVGGAYDSTGAARAALWGQCTIRSFAAPASKIADGRLASTRGGYGGLYSSMPSGSTLMSGSQRTPASGYISFTPAEIALANSAAKGATLYFVLGVMPPSSFTGSVTQHSITNDGDEAGNLKGWILQPGETLYWKTGDMTFPSQPIPTLASLQLKY
ncbi:MAG: hypothetical protein PHI93_12485 [Kiritimatiellae bacterium]|nr:hypothetical protein [Kiritimatiellia bacterium]